MTRYFPVVALQEYSSAIHSQALRFKQVVYMNLTCSGATAESRKQNKRQWEEPAHVADVRRAAAKLENMTRIA